jgi:DNA-binding helix-hairpin-helix protein with protein kinase domain
MTVRVLTGGGKELALGRRLGEGGEGVVYEVPGTGLVAKLLIAPADPARVALRLDSLVRQGRSTRTAVLLAGKPCRAAWPVDTLRAISRGEPAQPVRGYLMPDMRGSFQPLTWLLRPGPRATAFPHATWDTLLRAAASLSRLIEDLHAAGYVAGDLKPANLWADDQANIGITDVDSFQFDDGIRIFPCHARTPEYTAPERIIAPGSMPDAPGDAFVLAVLIYQLLMEGMHPFSGIPADGTRYVSVDDNIRHGRARLVAPGSVRVAPGAPPLSALPRQLRQLFHRAFGDDGRHGRAPRPTAREWTEAISSQRAPNRLLPCRDNARHTYTAERPWCPWCEIKPARR